MSRSLSLVVCLTLFAACVTTGPVAPLDARAHSQRTWAAATDEVYDATWLTLEAHGFAITDDDRLAGTLVATRDGRAWDVEVAALGSNQRVTLQPRTPLLRAELDQVLEVLEEGTRALLAAWSEPPEWTFDGRRNLLRAPGVALSPPASWEWLDFDLSRRVVTVQESKRRTGPNRTLLVELDRARPRSRLRQTTERAIEDCLSARGRLSFPDQLGAGTVRVLDGTTPATVTVASRELKHGMWQVRLVVACLGEECVALPEPLITTP